MISEVKMANAIFITGVLGLREFSPQHTKIAIIFERSQLVGHLADYSTPKSKRLDNIINNK